MKTLIIYETKNGYTLTCAQMIAELLGETTNIVKVSDSEIPSIQDYDLVIIGSAVYAENIPSSIRKFCRERENELIETPLALYMCALAGPKFKDIYYKRGYSKVLLNHALELGWFGGVMALPHKSRVVSSFLSLFFKGDKVIHTERLEEIGPFVDSITEKMQKK